ncbi:hypothetical protein [Nostoc sp. S13]
MDKKDLRDVLLSAFPQEADLEIMLKDKLEIVLNRIVSGNNYTIVM